MCWLDSDQKIVRVIGLTCYTRILIARNGTLCSMPVVYIYNGALKNIKFIPVVHCFIGNFPKSAIYMKYIRFSLSYMSGLVDSGEI